MKQTIESKNKELVLEAFDTLFNKRDYGSAEKFWSPNYIQHSAHIAPGREGLFNLVKAAPPSLKYESGVILAEGDYVIVHGRFSNIGLPVNWIAADIVRLNDIPVFDENPILQANDVGCNPVHRQSDVGEPAMNNDVVAFCKNHSGLILKRQRSGFDEVEEPVSSRLD